MNITTVCIGFAMIAFGLLTMVLRVVRPAAFSKLTAMKRRWGERAGLWLHFWSYTALPILGGAIIAIRGWGGAPFF